MAKPPTRRAPKRTAAEMPLDASSIGNTGLRSIGGFISEDFTIELQGLRGAEVYKEMADSDFVCGAVLFAVTMLTRNVTWNVQSVDDTPEAEDAKDFVEEVLDDMSMSFSDVMQDICSMFRHGYAPLEIVWKRRGGNDTADPTQRSRYDDGRIGVRALSLRSQRTLFKWEINQDDTSILGLWQMPQTKTSVFIPIEKLLLFRTSSEMNNPEGRSILRSAYRSWRFKRRLEDIEGIGIERDLAGLPVVKVPRKIMAADADLADRTTYRAYQTMVRNIRRDAHEGIVMPSSRDKHGQLEYELTLLSTAGSRAFDTTKVLERYDRAIATSVLADFIFLGQQSVGSFALSSDKTAVFSTALGGFLKSIADVFNRHLLPRLWRYNALDPAIMPIMSPGDVEDQDLVAVSSFVTSLAGAGMPLFPDRELENHLRELGGFPPAPEDGVDSDMGAPGEMEAQAGDDKLKSALTRLIGNLSKPGDKSDKSAKRPVKKRRSL